MLRLIILAVVSATALSAALLDLDREWMIFKKTHNRVFSEVEESISSITLGITPDPHHSSLFGITVIKKYWREIWERNLKMIMQHNLDADRGVHTYRLGMNHLGDMTTKEINVMLNGYKMSANRAAGSTYLPPSNVHDLPSSVDWRTKGYVTPVKDQGDCGSCWAFSATGSLEGQHFKKTGTLVSLSEQNLVDCSRKEGNKGCEGGLMDNAFQYINLNRGIDTESSYPYEAKDRKCHFSRGNVGATDTGYMDVQSGSENQLQVAVATVGPVSVAINGSLESFHFYTSGVYYDAHCSSTALDHGVLAVGYGTQDSKDYWIVKNSWGIGWGMQGYILMSRNRDNNCGIATMASYPLV